MQFCAPSIARRMCEVEKPHRQECLCYLEDAVEVRKIVTFAEETLSEAGQPAEPPLRKVAVVAVREKSVRAALRAKILSPLTKASLELGRRISCHRRGSDGWPAGAKLWQGRPGGRRGRAGTRRGDAHHGVRKRDARSGRRREKPGFPR